MRGIFCAVLGAAGLTCAPAAAATNGQLAGASGTSLVSFNADGTGLHTLWTGADPVSSPAWSPDGNTIAFAAGGKIMRYDLASGQARALTAGPADGSPVWAPDGTGIAFAHGGDVAGITPDGTPDGDDDEPSDEPFSPQPITGFAMASDASAFAVVTGGYMVRLIWSSAGFPPPVERVAGDPAFSPDAKTLAYAQGNASGGGSQVYMDPGGAIGGAGAADADTGPGFSPDGTTLAFAHASGAKRTLRMLALADRSLRDIAIAATDPDWQPCVAGKTASCTSTTPPGGDKPQDRAPGTHGDGKQQGAAPKLTVLSASKLDGHGRVKLRARCDRACTVSLRVDAKLGGGRMLAGRAAKARAAAGKTLKLTLRRRALPKRRHVVSARVAGTVTGADGLRRAFTLRLKLR